MITLHVCPGLWWKLRVHGPVPWCPRGSRPPGRRGGDRAVPGAVHGRARGDRGGHVAARDAGQPARPGFPGQPDRDRLRHVLRRVADAWRPARRPLRPPAHDPGQPGRVRPGSPRRGDRAVGPGPGRGPLPAGCGCRGVSALRAAPADHEHRRGTPEAARHRGLERGGGGGGRQRLCGGRHRHRPDQLACDLLGLPAPHGRAGRGHRGLGTPGRGPPAGGIAEPGRVADLHSGRDGLRGRRHRDRPAGWPARGCPAAGGLRRAGRRFRAG